MKDGIGRLTRHGATRASISFHFRQFVEAKPHCVPAAPSYRFTPLNIGRYIQHTFIIRELSAVRQGGA